MNLRAWLRSLLPSAPTLSDAEADRMLMDRRTFLKYAGATVAGAAVASQVDLEQLLWTPGKIIVDAPKVQLATLFDVGDVFTIEGCYVINPQTRRRMNQLQQFVVTESIRSDEPIVYGQKMLPRLFNEGLPLDQMRPLHRAPEHPGLAEYLARVAPPR